MNVSYELVIIGQQQVELMKLSLERDALKTQLEELKQAMNPNVPAPHE